MAMFHEVSLELFERGAIGFHNVYYRLGPFFCFFHFRPFCPFRPSAPRIKKDKS